MRLYLSVTVLVAGIALAAACGGSGSDRLAEGQGLVTSQENGSTVSLQKVNGAPQPTLPSAAAGLSAGFLTVGEAYRFDPIAGNRSTLEVLEIDNSGWIRVRAPSDRTTRISPLLNNGREGWLNLGNVLIIVGPLE